jgi:MATE efflux family protein
MSDKYTFLTQAPVHRVIGAMAIPTIISMLLTSMYNLVDTFFVGQINTQSTAAVGVVFSVMFFIQAFSFFWIFSNLE